MILMNLLDAMTVFVAVAERSSFAAAARVLHRSRPAVTRSIAALEEEVGAQLLIRTTRSVTLSRAGARYLKDCRRILESVEEARAAASGSYAVPRGVLVLTAPTMFGRLHVMPMVRDFLEDHEEVQAQVLLLDRVVHLVNEGVDVGVRIGHLRDSGQMAVRVGEVKMIVVGSPGYLERHGVPQTPEDLRDHIVVANTGALHTPEWRFGHGLRVPLTPRIQNNDTQSLLDLAHAGFGLARVLSYQASAGLQAGTLRRVLPEYEPEPLPVHLVYPQGRRMPARTRAFLDHATQALRARNAEDWA